MSFFNLSKQHTAKEIDSTYMGIRNMAFKTTYSDLGILLDKSDQVYAAIVDMPVKDNIATLVCFLDGTVSLYYSNGGGNLGLGAKQ